MKEMLHAGVRLVNPRFYVASFGRSKQPVGARSLSALFLGGRKAASLAQAWFETLDEVAVWVLEVE